MTKEKIRENIDKKYNQKNIKCLHRCGYLKLSLIDTKNDRVYYVTTCKKCGYELNINY